VTDFQESIKGWMPANHVPEGEWARWGINEDGSITITLPSALAANLADELKDWEKFGESWVNRPECQNWKRSPIARENRRENIVYRNCLSSIECLLGRREVKALVDRIKELDGAEPDVDQPTGQGAEL
jgi:hypothetical protein